MSSTAASEEVLIVHQRITESIDRLSLEQALRDTEVATARVIDLTSRLTSANEELLELRRRLVALESTQSPAALGGGLRLMLAPPLKAIARLVLPVGVRARIRTLLT